MRQESTGNTSSKPRPNHSPLKDVRRSSCREPEASNQPLAPFREVREQAQWPGLGESPGQNNGIDEAMKAVEGRRGWS